MTEPIYVEPARCLHRNLMHGNDRCFDCGAQLRWVVEKPVDYKAATGLLSTLDHGFNLDHPSVAYPWAKRIVDTAFGIEEEMTGQDIENTVRYCGLVTYDNSDRVFSQSMAYLNRSDAWAFVERVTAEAENAGRPYRGNVIEIQVENDRKP